MIVENLQAAESVADRFRDVGVFYTAGMLGVRPLELLAGLAALAERVVLAVDADAGGVRIAEQVLSVAPSAVLLDAGAHPHARRDPWVEGGLARASLDHATTGLAGHSRARASPAAIRSSRRPRSSPASPMLLSAAGAEKVGGAEVLIEDYLWKYIASISERV